MENQYDVLGMHCAGCAARVEKKVRALAGVESATVNLVGHCLTVVFQNGAEDDDAIVAAVTGAGFKCTPLTPPKAEAAVPLEPETKPESEEAEILRRLLPSLGIWLAIVLIMILKMTGVLLSSVPSGLVQLLLTLVIFFMNRQIFQNGYARLFHGADMDSLVALGCTSAFLLSVATLIRLILKGGQAAFFFESSSMILVIVSFGKFLEAKAKGKAGAALEKLRDLAPKTVLRIRNGKEEEVQAASIVPGDLVAVRPGGRIPFDGEIREGASSIDESSLTGESIPRDVTAGAKVFAGTMNLTGAFVLQASAVGQDTLLAGIIRLVAQSALTKSRAVRLADAIAARFVPIVGAVSLLTVLVWLLCGSRWDFALNCAISVLVVSCPCALGLATPVAVTVAMARAARDGILFKSAEALEKLRGIDMVFLDKTGTVTTGMPAVTDVFPHGAGVMNVAYALEIQSEHPVARAIVAEADKRGLLATRVEGFESSTGRGVRGTMEGEQCLAGNAAFLQENGIALPDNLQVEAARLEAEGKTVLFVAKNQAAFGLIAVRDSIAPESAEAVQTFRQLGLAVQMLTGDNERTAKAIAKSIGIDTVQAALMPAGKEAAIRAAQKEGHRVAMVGDGINDAPALAASDAAIAIGTGTDIAIDCADIVAMRNSLMDAVNAIRIARRTLLNIRQNLFWAFFYNILMIPVAAGCLYPVCGLTLNPMLAAVAMSLSSLCVVTNALRLGR